LSIFKKFFFCFFFSSLFEQILQLHALITLCVYICFVRWHPRLRQATARVEPAQGAHGAAYFDHYKQMWGTTPPPATAAAAAAGRGGGTERGS
jgi:hypothetical protein